MGAAGFKGTVTLTVSESGAAVTDAVTGHSVCLTELEGRLLQHFRGQAPEALASEAQAAGIGLWPDQVRVVLERIEAHGFLAQPLSPQLDPGSPLLPSDVVPRFRSDLSLSKAPGSRTAVCVVDPVTQQSFSLFDFEASIARMLNGSRTVGEVVELAAKIGIPVTADSLDRYIRQLRSFGFLDSDQSSAAATAWDPRESWSPEVRELFQAALRLMRSGHPNGALNYLDAILQTDPQLPEALELRARAEAAASGVIDLTLPFNELHAAPGAPLPAVSDVPPPLPDEEKSDLRKQVLAPPKIEGLGILPTPSSLPAPRTSPPRVAPLAAPPPAVAPFVAPAVAPFVAPAVAPYVAPAVAPYVAPAGAPARATLVFGSNPLGDEPLGPPKAAPVSSLLFGNAPLEPVSDASAPRTFSSGLFGPSAGPSSLGADPVPNTEPAQPAAARLRPPVSSRREVPPSASPPPHGAQALADALGGSEPNVPTVDADLAHAAPPAEQVAKVEVDSMVFVPQGSSIEVDPSLLAPVAPAFSAEASDAPPPAYGALPDELRSGHVPDAVAQTPIDPSYSAQEEPMVLKGEPIVAKRRGKALPIAAGAVTLLALGMAVPVPRWVEATCALSPVVLAEPRAVVDGQVAELIAKSGDVVAADTVLVKLTIEETDEAKALAEKEAAARAKVDRIKANVKGSSKAKKANAALAKADKELSKARAAWAKLENKKASPEKAKAKKALDARQKAKDKAQAAADNENGTTKRAALEAEANAFAAEREKLMKTAPGTSISAPAGGRFEAPAKHAVGMSAGERYGLIVDPALWKVTAVELPPGTEPATARVHLENGRIVDLTSTTVSGDGPTRKLEGNANLTDDAAGAGKTVLKVRAGRRPLAVVLLGTAKSALGR
jgi:hypothetical protein